MVEPDVSKSMSKKGNTLYPLSNPKGIHFDCELCGQTATLQCPHCKVTYYWSAPPMIVDDGAVGKST